MVTILLVDDEPDLRETARHILADEGYRVLEAGDVEEALRLARESREPIDLLLTDVVMPGKHGHELAAELKAARPELKVLYMSAFALVQAQHEMLETKAALEPGSPLLPKPFSPDALVKKVSEVLATPKPARSPFARGPRRSDPWWP